MLPTECWVIFDTCTRQTFYQDVHNLLALPAGSILRYDYRSGRLSANALNAAQLWQKWDAVLLVYAQSRGYTKKSPDPTAIFPFDDMLWVPTRLATMRFLMKAPGDVYYFDLLLEGYPDIDDQATKKILFDLHQAGDIPYQKWVATAHDRPTDFSSSEDGWNKIVDRLGIGPSQFAGDTFWRLQGGRPQVRLEVDQATRKESQARSYFVIYEPDRLRFSLTTYTAQGPAILERTLGVVMPANAPVDLEQSQSLPLRPYATQPLVLRANRSDLLDDRQISVRLTTTPDDGGWATGPNLDVLVQVRKKAWKLIVGTLLVVIGGVIASKGVIDVVGASSIIGLGVTVVGGLVVVAGLLLVTGKLALRL